MQDRVTEEPGSWPPSTPRLVGSLCSSPRRRATTNHEPLLPGGVGRSFTVTSQGSPLQFSQEVPHWQALNPIVRRELPFSQKDHDAAPEAWKIADRAQAFHVPGNEAGASPDAPGDARVRTRSGVKPRYCPISLSASAFRRA